MAPAQPSPFHLACICARLGKLVGAKRCLKEAIQLAQDKATLDRPRVRVLDEPALGELGRRIGDLGD